MTEVKPELARIIGRNLQQARIRLNLRVEDVARATGYSVSTIQTWEQGRHTPSIEALVRLAEFYDVSLDYLVSKAPPSSYEPLRRGDIRGYIAGLRLIGPLRERHVELIADTVTELMGSGRSAKRSEEESRRSS